MEEYIKPGDFYEDSFYHPCICVSVDMEADSLSGISLIDGSFPRSCSLRYSGVRILTLSEVVYWKFQGPKDIADFEASWLAK